MKIKQLIEALERFAPLPLQDSYDNAGLQIGLTEADVARVLLCLDVTPEVLAEAVREGCNVVISHHPLLFHPLKRIAGDSMVERCTAYAIRHDLCVYSAHTNLDNARGGVSYKMAEKMNLRDVQPLDAETGAGVLGALPEPMEPEAFLRMLKERFEVGCVKYAGAGGPVSKVALCGGAGDFLIPLAAQQGADAFVTGEIHYHRYFDDRLLLAEIGHYESEQYTTELFKQIITEQFPDVPVRVTSVRTNPIKYL